MGSENSQQKQFGDDAAMQLSRNHAIMKHGVGCVILSYKQNLKKGEIFALIASTLDEMETLFRSTPRPFIYTVSGSGTFRAYVRGRRGA